MMYSAHRVVWTLWSLCTGAFDLLSSLQGWVLVVYWLTGQGEDPDLRHLPQHFFLVAAERQDLASLRRVLHHLGAKHERGEKTQWEECFTSVRLSDLSSLVFDSSYPKVAQYMKYPPLWRHKIAIECSPPTVNSKYHDALQAQRYWVLKFNVQCGNFIMDHVFLEPSGHSSH